MGWFDRWKWALRPLRREDPEFGALVFQYVPNDPERSYWEAQWTFPPVGYPISISLPGGPEGPNEGGRAFFLALVARFDGLLPRLRPGLEAVFRAWLERPLAADPWRDLVLSGFDVERPTAVPVEWEVSFETTGSKWLGITIPMRGDTPGEPVVDT